MFNDVYQYLYAYIRIVNPQSIMNYMHKLRIHELHYTTHLFLTNYKVVVNEIRTFHLKKKSNLFFINDTRVFIHFKQNQICSLLKIRIFFHESVISIVNACFFFLFLLMQRNVHVPLMISYALHNFSKK